MNVEEKKLAIQYFLQIVQEFKFRKKAYERKKIIHLNEVIHDKSECINCSLMDDAIKTFVSKIDITSKVIDELSDSLP